MFNWKRLKSGLLTVVAILASLGLFLKFRSCDRQKDILNETRTLNPNEVAKVIVDPYRRRLTLVTPEHIKTFTLPDRPSSVALLKAGGLKVNSPQFGTEVRPFLGVVYTLEGGRILGGLDLLYWKLLDIGGGLSVNPKFIQDSALFIGVSCTVYSNTSIIIGLDSSKLAMAGIRVRL